MNTIPNWFFVVLLVNALTALIYAAACANFGVKKRSWGIRTLVMLLCPIVGAGFFFLSWLLYRFIFRRPVDLSSVVFSKDRVEIATKPNEEMERNFVPLEEALAVTDKRNLRELMMDIVRRDYRESLSTIALALNSEDTETAHYAASVLQDVLNDFRVDVQKQYQTVMEAMDSGTELEAAQIQALQLMELLDSMLRNHVLTDLEQAYYTHRMAEVGEKLYPNMDSTVLESIALRMMEVGNYAASEQWCHRIVQLYPDMLCAYTTRLKLYYTNGQREKFFSVMEQLKQSEVVVDQQTLNLIRAFI